ncbi:ClbS/DfsB family four-helix bundle protein [Jannaschia marina]|uniref:ClbS/DfsB family four-helix bundle protein n=1 Tax=Jannaschia marina TaxID=2741674 RepID=UPI0015CD2502|nr:ClbS/DfsB family four-helix bundle protein [Jannaschia marina]
MPATTKDELLALFDRDYAKLRALIDGIPEAAALRKGDDDVSIKDIVGHRAHWIALFLGWQAEAAAGGPVHIPAEGYKWSELKAYNAKVRADQAHMSWPETRALLADGHARILRFVQETEAGALYGPPMVGQTKWTVGRYAEASGPSHYRSAVRAIRALLRQMPDS